MKPLHFESERISCYIRPDQSKTLEQLKFIGKTEKNTKIPKTEIIRVALDLFFEMNDEKILDMLIGRINSRI